MKSKVFGPILAALLVFGGFAGGSANADWDLFHPFRHRRCNNQVVVYPQPQQTNFQWKQDGIFKARFVTCPFFADKCKERHNNYCDHWVTGYLTQDGYYDDGGNFHPWIYYTSLIADPTHPGVVTDVEQIFKDLENDIANIFHKHHDRLVGPKVEQK